MQGRIFQATNAAAINATADFTEPPETFLHPFETIIYYVSPCTERQADGKCSDASDNGNPVPALYKQSLVGNSMQEALVARNVESVQMRVGIDTDSDGSVDSMVDTNNIIDWSQAESAEIGILVRAPREDDEYLDSRDGRQDAFASDARGSYTLAGETINREDGFRREVFSSLVYLRN